MLLHPLLVLTFQLINVSLSPIDCIEEDLVYGHSLLVLVWVVFVFVCNHVLTAAELIFLSLRELLLELFRLMIFLL